MSEFLQTKVAATYMRGGTSKGVFFHLHDLPIAAQTVGLARDQFLLRVIGSPDPYAKQIDGMGGATSSTSKVVIIRKSHQPDHDIDYLFGQVSIDRAFIDWSGNCGNLSAAVGAFAIHQGLIDSLKIPKNGRCTVRIWQQNIQKTIVAHIPICQGQVQEIGDFQLDGVTFPAAEIQLEFFAPAEGDAIFPTGKVKEQLDIPDVGSFQVTMINSGIPTVFLCAEEMGLTGTELQNDVNNNIQLLEKFEKIRAFAAVKMGLIQNVEEAITRQHTPKIAFIASAKSYQASNGQMIACDQIDILVRALSMGKLHHAMMGTAAVAIGTAAAIRGTVVNLATGKILNEKVKFGHPSGTLTVGANIAQNQYGQWEVMKVMMSRSARRLMEGWVFVPEG